MTMLTAGMLQDRQTTKTETAVRKGAMQRLRSSLKGGRRLTRRSTTAGRPNTTLLHDVASGGTAASAANNYLKSLAAGRRV